MLSGPMTRFLAFAAALTLLALVVWPTSPCGWWAMAAGYLGGMSACAAGTLLQPKGGR